MTACWWCTIRVAHDDCAAVVAITPPAPTVVQAAVQAWREASVELEHATRAYHEAIDDTERAASVCNFAWYAATRTTERETAERYTAAVRREHVTRAAMVATIGRPVPALGDDRASA